MKKHLFLIIAVVIILMLIIVSVIKEINSLKEIEKRGIGKDLYFEIKEGQVADYSFMYGDSLSIWAENEKMAEYMKENNLSIVEGLYVINQTTTFDEALKILKFKSEE